MHLAREIEQSLRFGESHPTATRSFELHTPTISSAPRFSRLSYVLGDRCYSKNIQNLFWCGGWDSNPRRPSPQDDSCSRDLKSSTIPMMGRSCPFDLNPALELLGSREPPPVKPVPQRVLKAAKYSVVVHSNALGWGNFRMITFIAHYGRLGLPSRVRLDLVEPSLAGHSRP